MSRTERKFNEAIAEALKSESIERHGAIVCSGGKTLGRGHNSLKPLRLFGRAKFGCYVHAEIAALVSTRRCGGRYWEKDKQKDRFGHLCRTIVKVCETRKVRRFTNGRIEAVRAMYNGVQSSWYTRQDLLLNRRSHNGFNSLPL